MNTNYLFWALYLYIKHRSLVLHINIILITTYEGGYRCEGTDRFSKLPKVTQVVISRVETKPGAREALTGKHLILLAASLSSVKLRAVRRSSRFPSLWRKSAGCLHVPVKAQRVSIFGSAGHLVSVTTTPLSHGGVKSPQTMRK